MNQLHICPIHLLQHQLELYYPKLLPSLIHIHAKRTLSHPPPITHLPPQLHIHILQHYAVIDVPDHRGSINDKGFGQRDSQKGSRVVEGIWWVSAQHIMLSLPRPQLHITFLIEKSSIIGPNYLILLIDVVIGLLVDHVCLSHGQPEVILQGGVVLRGHQVAVHSEGQIHSLHLAGVLHFCPRLDILAQDHLVIDAVITIVVEWAQALILQTVWEGACSCEDGNPTIVAFQLRTAHDQQHQYYHHNYYTTISYCIHILKKLTKVKKGNRV